jgi:hypothetical protein
LLIVFPVQLKNLPGHFNVDLPMISTLLVLEERDGMVENLIDD